jgi:hypothetical protein
MAADVVAGPWARGGRGRSDPFGAESVRHGDRGRAAGPVGEDGRVDQRRTVARATTPQGDLAIRASGDVTELIVNGVFAMDSVDTSSEAVLADAAGAAPGRVLVGGLGLGYTVARLLDNGAAAIDCVELAEPLIGWARDGITPTLARVASDPRVRLHHGDIATWLAASQGCWDAILLDVDNGPGFLIHDANAAVYERDWLTVAFGRVAASGVLVIWCEGPSPALARTLAGLGAVEEILVPVQREGRSFVYALYRLHRPATVT